MKLKILTLVLAILCVSAKAADLIPVEDFAKAPACSDLRLSLDGRYCASLRAVDGRNFIEFTDLETATVQKFDPGRFIGGRHQRSVLKYCWLGSKRVLADISDGYAAFERDGQNFKAISGSAAHVAPETMGLTGLVANPTKEPIIVGDVIYPFRDDVHALLTKHPWQGAAFSPYPEVIKMNTETGFYDTVVSNPGDVVRWMADRKGVVRMGVQQKSIDDIKVIYREDEKSPWRPVAVLSGAYRELPSFHGFSADGKGVYVAAVNTGGYKALYCYDLATGRLGEPLLEVPGFDVGPSSGAIWSEFKQALVGFTYMTDGPHLKCFDEEFARNMAEVDSLLPNMFNNPVSISDDGRRILILSSSDRNPGAYYLYYTDTKKLEPILRTRPWIKPEQLAPMNPITYTTRDGLVIHGYLTIPLGQKPRNLPLVILERTKFRNTWGFDPLTQMLANRGYAVLQVNHRGSPGNGVVFAKKGEHEIGGAIQQDIEDATRWAISKKVADPKRIAVVGLGGLGGYSALYALGKSPDLYCCGITMYGIIDLLDIFEHLDDVHGRTAEFSRQSMILDVGDPKVDAESFKAKSPVNLVDKIVAPVLFIHGKIDRVIPPEMVRKMIDDLKKVGGKPEALFIDFEDAAAKGMDSRRLQEYKAIEAFLEKHLGPGTSAAGVPAKAVTSPAGSGDKK